MSVANHFNAINNAYVDMNIYIAIDNSYNALRIFPFISAA